MILIKTVLNLNSTTVHIFGCFAKPRIGKSIDFTKRHQEGFAMKKDEVYNGPPDILFNKK